MVIDAGLQHKHYQMHDTLCLMRIFSQHWPENLHGDLSALFGQE